MNLTLKKKISAFAGVFINLLTVTVICITGNLVMQKAYYSYIFVSGQSMHPTLIGGHSSGAKGPSYDHKTGVYTPGDTVHFGISDESIKAKQNIQRYDIVTVYYPWSDYDSSGNLKKNADYKIKRVIALPGETFVIEQGVLKIKQDGVFNEIPRAHLIDDGGNPSVKDVTEQTLGENQYWVMGDHRSNSSDCATISSGKYRGPVTFNNIIGVLVSIEGTAEYFNHYYCDSCNTEVDDTQYLKGEITTCPKCHGHISIGAGDIRNREYTYPRII